MMQEKVLTGVPGLRIVVFQWSAKHGDCQECGLPAAFLYVDAYGPNTSQKLCAVCAANAAADGAYIRRIEEPELWVRSGTG